VLGAVVLRQPSRDEPTDRTTPDDEDPSHARTLSDRRRDQSSTRKPSVGVVKRTGEAPSSLGISDV
jgi:hypothetical protein